MSSWESVFFFPKMYVCQKKLVLLKQAKPEHLPEKEPFIQPEHMKFGKTKFGTFMNRNSSASSSVVWSNERSCFSAPGEGPWSYSHFHLQKYSRQAQMGNRRLALGWDHLSTPDVCQRIAGGQQRYLPVIVNKPWFEATEKKNPQKYTGPLADSVASNPDCECTLKDDGVMTEWYVIFR